jgi:hypothetical protein
VFLQVKIDVYFSPEGCGTNPDVPVVAYDDAKTIFVSYDATIAPTSKKGKPNAIFDSSRPDTIRKLDPDAGEDVGEPEGKEMMVGKSYAPKIASGLHDAFPGLCAGSKASVTVPEDHAWGPEGRPINNEHVNGIKGGVDVPLMADVHYDIEIKRIRDVFAEMDKNGSGEISFEQMIKGIEASKKITLTGKQKDRFKDAFDFADEEDKERQKPFGDGNGTLNRAEFK